MNEKIIKIFLPIFYIFCFVCLIGIGFITYKMNVDQKNRLLAIEEAINVETTGEIIKLELNEANKDKEVNYHIKDTSIVKVNEDGNLVSVGEGSTTVTVTTKDNNQSQTIVVNVGEDAIKEYQKNEQNQDSTNNNTTDNSTSDKENNNSNNIPDESSNNTQNTTIETEIKEIILSQSSINLYIGDEITLTATIKPETISNSNLTWTSSNNSIVSVQNGKIKAISAGTATITVKTKNNKTATCKVNVKKVQTNTEVTNIYLNKNSLNMTVGDTNKIVATITPNNATNKTITYKSQNNKIATVDQQGNIKAIGVGTTTISANTNNGVSASCKVVVSAKKIEVTKIELNTSKITLDVKNNTILTATITPSNATNKKITWSSSNNEVATVYSNGKVIGKKAGTATITATSTNGKKATVKVIVNKTPTNETEVCEYIERNGLKQVLYDDFKKVINNKDDYYAIKATHDCANKLNLPVLATEKATYNIYNLDNKSVIKVLTSTNLNNSTIYIHDESGIVDTKAGKRGIFSIENPTSVIELDSTKLASVKSKIKKSTKKISQLSGYGNALVKVVNDNKKQFIRYGTNANDGASQMDVFKIDNNGNVLNDIIWDFNNVTAVYIYKIPSNTLTFRNGNFITIADTSISESISGYSFRGIKISRSNTIINNIDHKVVDSSKKEIQSIKYAYRGFINITESSDVTIKNTNLYALNSARPTSSSTYDFTVNRSVNITVYNLKIPYNQLSGDYWGVMGSNYIKDVTFTNCRMNRIDSHSGVHNLTVSNSTIGDKGFTLIGSGKLKITNTTVRNASHFIHLRQDYGSTWDGSIEITDSTFIPSTTTDASLISLQVSFDNNVLHDFGYDIVLPNISINNLKINKNISNFYIYNNSNTGLLNGNLSKANNYTGGKFNYIIPTSIKYSNITSTATNINISKYMISF